MKNRMKKLLQERQRLLRTIWRLGKCCLALGYVLWGFYESFRAARSIYSRIPSDEILKRVDVRMFTITYITNTSEYVAFNYMIIILAVILGIAFLALLILLGIYMNPRNSPQKKTEKIEDGSDNTGDSSMC